MENTSEKEIGIPLRISFFNGSFLKEITNRHGGEKLSLCYQCGSCTGGCPVGKITDSYHPRRLIRMAILGLKDNVISTESIWLCASCYTCQERCPQGVEIADLMLVLRNISSENGHTPKSMLTQASTLIEKGRIAEPSSLMQRRRKAMGLPDLPKPPAEIIGKIVQKTGLTTIIEKNRGVGNE